MGQFPIARKRENSLLWVAKIDWEQIREVDEESYAIALRRKPETSFDRDRLLK